MMRSQNIVLFSSGVSEKSGILMFVKKALEMNKSKYHCSYWRDLFSDANDPQNIALLPMLIKKIPTFDFAILICEGHDETDMFRDKTVEHVRTMRDNVLFEIGLCSMALGLNRVILLTDGSVRLPEDLQGTNKQSAIKVVCYNRDQKESFQNAAVQMMDYLEDISTRLQNPNAMEQVMGEIDAHINSNIHQLYPTVIGASVAMAIGYMSNFVLRTLEKCAEGVTLTEDSTSQRFVFPDEKVFMHIILPTEYSVETPSRSEIMKQSLSRGTVPYARSRIVSFHYKLQNDELHIYDYPTTLVTEYQVARSILAIDADDQKDSDAEKRFNAKELDLFEFALKSLKRESFIRTTVEHFYQNDTKEEEERLANRLIAMMPRVDIRREDY